MFKICNTASRALIANNSFRNVTAENVIKMGFASQNQPAFKYEPVSPKIKELQAKFQKKDDVPVFLKGGPMDQILYRTTMGLVVVGTCMVIHFLVEKIYATTK